MGPKVRSVVAVIVGVGVSFGVVFGVEALDVRLYPLPPGIDMHDTAQFAALMRSMPVAALALVVLGWALGALVGSTVAAWIARGTGRTAALVVGALFLLASLMNLVELPHPIWMWVAGLAMPLPLALLGGGLGARRAG